MDYYAVKSGNVFKCVFAEDESDAVRRAVLQTIDDRLADHDPEPVAISQSAAVHKCGDSGLYEVSTEIVTSTVGGFRQLKQESPECAG